MSRRARSRAAAVAAKRVALVPLDDDDPRQFEDDEADDECSHCHGDGMDPMNDYLLACPICGGEG